MVDPGKNTLFILLIICCTNCWLAIRIDKDCSSSKIPFSQGNYNDIACPPPLVYGSYNWASCIKSSWYSA
ncbi:hypothetical protein L873DRAFT_1047609 [Choiromyces venosus 120613-1]|uniref:Uncharacterized protein n=1 Tax=Choiromyces venosus 120613-1 TaxID=1336337 RepID=A0A3N4JJ16_9PEZI|nr:hypothetical protein L873DRAFT_1047609 [Choiromyces venosus 120613-1]